jgi:hypothetical protein
MKTIDPMIYTPAMTCSEEEFSKKWKECQEANMKRLEEIENKAIAQGGLLYRFLYEGVADGKAIYQIIRVNKTTVRVRVCSVDGCFYDYVVPQWGDEATIPKEYAESGIRFQDLFRSRFGRKVS